MHTCIQYTCLLRVLRVPHKCKKIYIYPIITVCQQQIFLKYNLVLKNRLRKQVTYFSDFLQLIAFILSIITPFFFFFFFVLFHKREDDRSWLTIAIVHSSHLCTYFQKLVWTLRNLRLCQVCTVLARNIKW
jgi:hypothetical protein